MREFDAIVIGIGGMGSAAVYHLARRGWRVLGLEQYDIPNEMGSSHGISRMIRLAYHEDPSYVPLLRRAYELWHQLENSSGERLLVYTGCLRGGVGASQLLEGSIATLRTHNLPYRLLTGPEVNAEWPGYQLPEDAVMVYEQNGGFLNSERSIVAHVSVALELGAEVHGREAVLSWETTASGGVKVYTDKNSYTANRLVITAGAWAGKLAPQVTAHAIPRTSGIGLVRSVSSRAVPSRIVPRVRRAGRRGTFLWIPVIRNTRLQSRLVQSLPGTGRSRYHAARANAPGRNSAAGIHHPVFSGSRWPYPCPQNLHVHQHAGRTFHNRRIARSTPGFRSGRLLRAWFQVLQRSRRGDG